MALRAALGWAGAQTAVRLVLGFVSAKVSAIYLGPAGMALVGQLGGFIQVALGSIGNGANTAVVTSTAKLRDDPDGLARLWSTALRLGVGLALLVGVLIILAAQPISSWLLSDAAYWPAVAFAGLVVVLGVADTILTGAVNGLGRIELVAKTAISSTVLEISIFASLAYAFGLWGGLFGAAAIYVVRIATNCTIAFGSGAIAPSRLMARFDGGTAREILRFYPMLLAQSIALPLGQILVRNGVIGTMGLEQTGYLQAAWRLSDMYVGVLTTALGLYFMAQFSALSEDAERGAMLRRTVAQVAFITGAAAVGVYLLRNIIIEVVLSPKFMPMGSLLPFHLLGDVFKMAGYPMQMALVARQRSRLYIAVSAGTPAAFVLLTHLLLPTQGMQAAPIAYAASYLCMLVVLLLAWRKTLVLRSGTSKEAGGG